jgi:hypothetical protein
MNFVASHSSFLALDGEQFAYIFSIGGKIKCPKENMPSSYDERMYFWTWNGLFRKMMPCCEDSTSKFN